MVVVILGVCGGGDSSSGDSISSSDNISSGSISSIGSNSSDICSNGDNIIVCQCQISWNIFEI